MERDEFADRELVTLVVNGQWCNAEMHAMKCDGCWCLLRWRVVMWLVGCLTKSSVSSLTCKITWFCCA